VTPDWTLGDSRTWEAHVATFMAAAEAEAAAPSRKMRLFEGFRIKFINGKIILHQQ